MSHKTRKCTPPLLFVCSLKTSHSALNLYQGTMATPLRPIECSAQPLCFSFHPQKDIVAAGLVDGTLEVHDLVAKKQAKQSGGRDDVSSDDSDDDDQHMDS